MGPVQQLAARWGRCRGACADAGAAASSTGTSRRIRAPIIARPSWRGAPRARSRPRVRAGPARPGPVGLRARASSYRRGVIPLGKRGTTGHFQRTRVRRVLDQGAQHEIVRPAGQRAALRHAERIGVLAPDFRIVANLGIRREGSGERLGGIGEAVLRKFEPGKQDPAARVTRIARQMGGQVFAHHRDRRGFEGRRRVQSGGRVQRAGLAQRGIQTDCRERHGDGGDEARSACRNRASPVRIGRVRRRRRAALQQRAPREQRTQHEGERHRCHDGRDRPEQNGWCKRRHAVTPRTFMPAAISVQARAQLPASAPARPPRSAWP